MRDYREVFFKPCRIIYMSISMWVSSTPASLVRVRDAHPGGNPESAAEPLQGIRSTAAGRRIPVIPFRQSHVAIAPDHTYHSIGLRATIAEDDSHSPWFDSPERHRRSRRRAK